MKGQATGWEKIFANHIFNKSLAHKEVSKPRSGKKKITQLENGQKMNRYFTAEDMQIANEKLFNITASREMQMKAPASPHTHQKS